MKPLICTAMNNSRIESAMRVKLLYSLSDSIKRQPKTSYTPFLWVTKVLGPRTPSAVDHKKLSSA